MKTLKSIATWATVGALAFAVLPVPVFIGLWLLAFAFAAALDIRAERRG